MVRPLRPQGVGSHRKGNHVVPVEARLDGRLNLSQLKEQIDQTGPKLEIPFEQFLKSFLVNLAGETATADETRRCFGIPEDNPNAWKRVWEELTKRVEILFALESVFAASCMEKKRKMGMELKSTELGSRSSVLKRVYLRVVLGSPKNDALLVWNSAFQQMVGLSWDELARTPLTSLLIVGENEEDPIMQSHAVERDNKNHLTNVHGQAQRCDDEMLLPMLDVNLVDLASDEFDQGRRMGCDEERKRTRHFFHDVLSSKMLVASFLAHEIYQKLAASGSEETEEMARLTKLLQEAIDAIVQGAEE
jgi:hypothetical protein